MAKKLILALIISAAVFAAGGCSFNLQSNKGGENKNLAEPAEIVIGFNADQTSAGTGGFGVSARQGFELAVEEINSQGGVLGKKIKAIIMDDQADKELSKKNMEQLINQDKAIAVVGPANSANALYWLPLAQDSETTVIVPIATASEITTLYKDHPRNYIFRITSLEIDQARIGIGWLIKATNNGKIAIIHDSTPYGMKGLKDGSEVLSRWGKTPVFVKSFEVGETIDNMKAILESAKSAGAEGIAFFCYSDSQANLLKALDQIKDYDPAIIGTAANLVPKFWELAGPLASKLPFVAGSGLNVNERTTAYKQKIINKFGHESPVVTSSQLGYDAAYLLKAAILKAGTLDKTAIRDAMENIENVQGANLFYEKPFSKENHEGVGIGSLFLVHYVDGKIEKFPGGDPSEFEIR
jgi:branched-chain amino acid transport system substrate-binding protein